MIRFRYSDCSFLAAIHVKNKVCVLHTRFRFQRIVQNVDEIALMEHFPR